MPRFLDLVSDEDLGREIFALWHSYYIQNLPFTINGASVSQITNKQLEQILPRFRAGLYRKIRSLTASPRCERLFPRGRSRGLVRG